MLSLWPIYFYFAEKEIAWCIFLGIKNVKSLKLKIQSESRYFDDLLTIDNTSYDDMVNQIYSLPKLQLNKTNSSDTEASFLDLHLNISDGIVS